MDGFAWLGFYGAALLGTVLLLAAGGLIAALVVAGDEDEDAPLRAVAVAVACGWGLVPSYAFFAHLLTGVHVARWLVGLAALAHGALLLVPGLRTRARAGWSVLRRLGRREHLLVLLAVFAVWLFYAVEYDPSPPPPEGSCIYSAALTATGHKDAELRLLVENVEDARLGNTAVAMGWSSSSRRSSLVTIAGASAALSWLMPAARARALLGSPDVRSRPSAEIATTKENNNLE